MSAGVICGDSGGGGGGGCVDRLSETRLQRCADVIVNAQYCPVCADHITCSTCLQVCQPHTLGSLKLLESTWIYKLQIQGFENEGSPWKSLKSPGISFVGFEKFWLENGRLFLWPFRRVTVNSYNIVVFVKVSNLFQCEIVAAYSLAVYWSVYVQLPLKSLWKGPWKSWNSKVSDSLLHPASRYLRSHSHCVGRVSVCLPTSENLVSDKGNHRGDYSTSELD